MMNVHADLVIYLLILLTTLVLGVVNYKKLTAPFKLLTILTAFTGGVEMYSIELAPMYHHTSQLYHFYHFVEYTFIALVYYYLFNESWLKKSILVSIGGIGLFIFINASVVQPFGFVLPSNVGLVCQIIYGLLALLLFKQMLTSVVIVQFAKQGVFWFNTAILFAAGYMFLHFGVINYYVKHKFNYQLLNAFSNIVNTVFYLLQGYAIWLNIKEKDAKPLDLATSN